MSGREDDEDDPGRETKWTVPVVELLGAAGGLEEDGAPEPLPMPLQNLLVSEAHNRMSAHGDPEVLSMPVGQIVGSMNAVRPVAEVMADLVAGFEDAVGRLDKIRSS